MNYKGLCNSFEFINLIYNLIDASGLSRQIVSEGGVVNFWDTGAVSFNVNEQIPKTKQNEDLYNFLNKYNLFDIVRPHCSSYFSHVIYNTICDAELFSKVMNNLHKEDAISIIKNCLITENQQEVTQALNTPALLFEATPYNNLCCNTPELSSRFKLSLYNAISSHYQDIFAHIHNQYFMHVLSSMRSISNTSDTARFIELFPSDSNYGLLYKYQRCPIVLQNYFKANSHAAPLFLIMADMDYWTDILRKDTTIEELQELSWCVIDESKLYSADSDSNAYRIGLNDKASVRWLMNQSQELISAIKKTYSSRLRVKHSVWQPLSRKKKMFLGFRDMICIIDKNELKISDNNLIHAFDVSSEKYDSFLIKEFFAESAIVAPNFIRSSQKEILDEIQKSLYGFLKELMLKELTLNEVQDLYNVHMDSCQNTEYLNALRSEFSFKAASIPRNQVVTT